MTYKPDLEQARTMLKALAPHDGAFFTFATIKGKVTKHFHGTLEQHASQLTALNQQGAGVYVTVNQTDGKGRKAENITAIRALFVDFDTVEPDRVENLLSLDLFYEGMLEPSLIVESSKGKHHAYWILDTPSDTQTTLKNFSQWQKQLINFFDSLGDSPDKAINDLSRVMRLAGFYHTKGEPVLTKIIYPKGGQDIQRYSYEQIKAMIDSLPAPLEQTSQRQANTDTSKAIISDDDFTANMPIGMATDKIKQCLSCIKDNIARENWLRVGMALHHEFMGGLDGLDLWDRWSETAPNYLGYDDLLATWESFSNSKGEPVTARTLLDMAKRDNPALYFATLEDWQDPQPIRQSLPAVKDIENDTIPAILFDFITDNANRLTVPKVYIAIPLLVGMGSVIGAKIAIKPKKFDNWHEVANLWGGLIGEPSTKKTPSLDTALEPLRKLEQQAKAKYEQDLKDHTAQSLISKATEKSLHEKLKGMVTKASNAEQKEPATDEQIKAIASQLAEKLEQTPPTLRRYIADDSTHEKLGELESQNPNGILVNRDELTGLFKYLDKPDNEQARTFYLEGFNGKGSKTFDRITRGTIFIENHCLSVLGGIQPEKIDQYLQRISEMGNDGLMQRFSLLVYPDRIPNSKEKDLPVNEQLAEQIQMIFDRLDRLDEWELSEQGISTNGKRAIVSFDDNAYPVFMAWYDDLKERSNHFEHGIIQQHLMKYPKTLLGITLVFHLVECITKNLSDWGKVNLPTLQQAIKFLGMLESHMIRIYTPIIDNAQTKAGLLANRLLNIIKQPARNSDLAKWLESGFTKRQLTRRDWQGLKNGDDVQTALDILTENHWLNWTSEQTTGQGGRPTERYFINPLLFEFDN